MAFEPSDGLVLCSTDNRGSALNCDGYIAQAAALEVVRVIREGGHFFCPELPAMDVQRFLSVLAELKDDVAGVSLALVGYDVSETDLRDRLNAMALLVGHVTTDLHVAARWRNERIGIRTSLR